MTATYTEILDVLKDNNISIVRWYTIDDIIYIVFSTLSRDTADRVNKLFPDATAFHSYNQIAIDMSNVMDEVYLHKRKQYSIDSRTKKERNIEIDNFKLD